MIPGSPKLLTDPTTQSTTDNKGPKLGGFNRSKLNSFKKTPSKIRTNVLNISNNLGVKNSITKSVNDKNEIVEKKSQIPISEKKNLTIRKSAFSMPKEKSFTLRKKSRTSLDFDSHSTTKLDQKINTGLHAGRMLNSARSSVSIQRSSTQHKRGEVPSYLYKKPPLIVVDPIVMAARRKFLSSKKKVTDAQSDFLACYKRLEEAQKKLSNEDKDYIKQDQVELISLISDKTGSFLMLKEDMKTNIKTTNVKHPDTNSMRAIKGKVLNLSESGFKISKDFIEHMKKLMRSDEQGGDQSTFVSELKTTIRKWENQLDETVKCQLLESNRLIKELEDLEKLSTDGKDQINTLNEKISEQKTTIESQKSKIDDMLAKQSQENDHSELIIEHKTQVANKQKEIAIRNNEIIILKKTVQLLEDQKLNIENKNESLSRELSENKNKNASLLKKIESLSNQNEPRDISFEEIHQLNDKISELKGQETEIKTTYEKKINKLEKELSESQKDLEKFKLEFKTATETYKKASNEQKINGNQLWDDFRKLKTNFDKVNFEKVDLENKLEEVKDMKVKSYKLEKKVEQLVESNKSLKNSIKNMEQELDQKTEIVNEYEAKFYNLMEQPKDFRQELNHLRESDSEKKREIQTLESELTKCRIEMKQQEETIYMHTRLLKIRSELINTLQEKEASLRGSIEDLHNEITKKSGLINQMNRDISAKAEELQNLFSTLSSKEMELSKQENLIQLLEENNERNQRLRVKQEEKLARLDHENSELKNVICIFQEDFPRLDFKEINGDFLEAKSKNDLILSSTELYNEERRKKRQISIAVKKIIK